MKDSAGEVGATQKGSQKERSMNGDLNFNTSFYLPSQLWSRPSGSTLQELSHLILIVCF